MFNGEEKYIQIGNRKNGEIKHWKTEIEQWNVFSFQKTDPVSI